MSGLPFAAGLRSVPSPDLVDLPSLTELRVLVSRDARIVHQQMYAIRLLLLQLLRQANAVVFARHVAWECVQATGTSVVLLDCGLQCLLPAACNVDLGAVGNEGLRDHEAYASPAARHDRRQERDIEEVFGRELLVLTFA